MSNRKLGVAIAAWGAISSASAGFTAVDYGSYTVTYDDSSGFGAPSFHTLSGSAASFGWSVPASVTIVNAAESVFSLPQFLITPNVGFALSGPVEVFLGNFVFSETSSPSSTATTSALLTGWAVKDEDYPAAALVLKNLNRNVTAASGSLVVGTYSGIATAATGAFSSFGFWYGQLTFETAGGYSAAVVGQPQNQFRINLVAARTTPVPEPSASYLMIAGGIFIGALAWRRTRTQIAPAVSAPPKQLSR